MKILYTARATARGGRDGKVKTENGRLEFDLATPKEMGGPGGEGTNPEELFACGYSACFHSAVKLVAARLKLDTSDSSVTAKVHFGSEGAAGFALSVELVVALPRLEREAAERLVETAHQVCPYSKATRNNIAVTLTVV